MIVKYVNCLLHLLKVLVLGILPIARKEKLMEWHSWWVPRTRIRVIEVNFDQGKRDLVGVSGEVELSEQKWLQSRVTCKGNGT